jgi:hypothetical protein
MNLVDVKQYINDCKKSGELIKLNELSHYLDNIIETMGCIKYPMCPYHEKCRKLQYCGKDSWEKGNKHGN